MRIFRSKRIHSIDIATSLHPRTTPDKETATGPFWLELVGHVGQRGSELRAKRFRVKTKTDR